MAHNGPNMRPFPAQPDLLWTKFGSKGPEMVQDYSEIDVFKFRSYKVLYFVLIFYMKVDSV